MKDSTPKSLRSRVVYQFSCVGCGACYVGETTFSLTRIPTFYITLKARKTAELFVVNPDCFIIFDTVIIPFQLKIRYALRIHWEKPPLNRQIFHVNILMAI